MATSIFKFQFDPNANQLIMPAPLDYNISMTPPVTPVVNEDHPELSTPITAQVQVIADPAIIALLKANPNITWISDVSP